MMRRYAGLVAIGLALGAGSASAQQSVDAAIAARAGDAALKTCLDRSQAVADYRTATQSVSRARDPKTPGKFNCSGIGASWQEVAPKACCAAFERDKGRNVDAAWTALQVCGWQAKTAERRPAYEAAARQCLAQTAAKPATPSAPQQQAQKPQTPAPAAPQQQAQRPQPTPPSAPHRAEDRPFTPPIFPSPAPSAPQRAEVPLTPPPPLAPLAPPPPSPGGGPAQPAQKPGDATERYLRAIEDSLGIQPGLLVTAESVYGTAGYVMYLDEKNRPWVVDTFGIHKPMWDWFQQRVAGEQFVLLTDERLKQELWRNLPEGAGNIAFIWSQDYGIERLKAASKLGQRGPVQGTSPGGYYALRVHGSDNAILSNRSLGAPTPPPGVNLVIYYYLWRRALAFSSGDWTPTAWDLARSINGGGDFIELRPAPRESSSGLHAAGRWTNPALAPIAMPAAAESGPSRGRASLRIELISGSADLQGFGGLVEVSGAGVSLIAVTHGTAIVRENATGTMKTAAAGSVVAVVPGTGVAAARMSENLRARVAARLNALPPIPPPGRPAADAERSMRQQLAADMPAITAVAPARGVKDGKPVEPGATFTPEVNPIYVWFRLEGVTAATKLRQVWHYLGAGADRTIGEGDFTAPAGAKWADVKFTLAEGKRWPLGEYRVEIFAGDRQLAAVPFSVAEAGAEPRIVQTQPARGVKDGKPVEPGEVFRPDAKTIYVWFRIAGVNAPTRLRGIWNYLRPGGDEFIVESEAVVQPGHDWGGFQIEGPPGRGWPVGNYRLDILLGDRKAASVPFRVAGAAQAVIVAARAARGVKNGEPVSPGETFAPDAGTIYVWFRLAGHEAPTALRGVWRYLGGGQDQVIISSELMMQPNQDWADFQLELPPGKPWPLGEYRVDILIGDKQAASVPFRIAAAAAQPAPKASAAPAAGAITPAGAEALLRELGADPQAKTRRDGVPYFEFVIDGRKTVLALYGCTPGPCAQALLHTGFKTDRKVDAQAINDWNREQRFVRAYLDRDGDPIVESDLVVAGAQIATMREWIATWRQRVPQFMAHLTK